MPVGSIASLLLVTKHPNMTLRGMYECYDTIVSVVLHKLTDAEKVSLRKACNREFTASYHGGSRSKFSIHTGVIHCTEAGDARGNASYFAGPNAGGSTQLIVDDTSCYRALSDLVIPYGAPGANMEGVHIEQCGKSAWSRTQWMAHEMTIRRAAYKMAVWCHTYNFPPVWLSVDALKSGNVRGVTSHRNVSLAFRRSDHTDPGPEDGKHYPYDYFLVALKRFYAEGN